MERNVPWYMYIVVSIIYHSLLYIKIQWYYLGILDMALWLYHVFFGNRKIVFWNIVKCLKNSGHISYTSTFICQNMKQTWNSVLNKQRPGAPHNTRGFIYPLRP